MPVGVSEDAGAAGCAIFAYRWDAGGKVNILQTAHNGFGIDAEPMRDFNDAEKISRWGIRHSIISMVPIAQSAAPASSETPTGTPSPKK